MDGFKVETDGKPFFLLGEIPLALRQFVVSEGHGLTLIRLPSKEEIEAAEFALEVERLREIEDQILHVSAAEAEAHDLLLKMQELFQVGAVDQAVVRTRFGL